MAGTAQKLMAALPKMSMLELALREAKDQGDAYERATR